MARGFFRSSTLMVMFGFRIGITFSDKTQSSACRAIIPKNIKADKRMDFSPSASLMRTGYFIPGIFATPRRGNLRLSRCCRVHRNPISPVCRWSNTKTTSKTTITTPVTIISVSLQDDRVSLFRFSDISSYNTLLIIILIDYNKRLFE